MEIQDGAPMGGDDELIDDATLMEMEQTPPLHSTPEQPAEPPQDQQQQPTGEADGEADAGEAGEAEGGDEAGGDKSKYVPHAKFNKVHQDLKRERETRTILEQRTNQLLSILENIQRGQQPPQQAQQAEEAKIPGPEDPMGRLNYVVERIQASEQEKAQMTEAQRRQQESIELGRRVAAAATQDFQAAAEEDPTIADAYSHLTRSRVSEIMRVQGLSQEQAIAAYHQEELELYYAALQRRERPSEVVKALAEARGWAPKPAEPPPNQQPNPAEADKRRQQHMSLSQLGGQAGRTGITAKDLAAMDEDDFAQLKDSTVKALMGGR